MLRTFFIVFFLIINIIPVYAASDQAEESLIRKQEPITETYKIKGKVEYNDNPIETIYLDENIKKPKVNIPKRSITLPVGVLNITSNSETPRSALARAMVNRSILNDILPLSGSITEQIGGFSYGQTWGQELSYSQMESTTAFFLRYDTAKRFSFTASARQSASFGIDSARYNAFRLTPEWHITDKLTLKDSFTSYVELPKNKNEIKLVYTPALKKYAESLKFELGIAQSYYANGKQSAAVNFSTGFKL